MYDINDLLSKIINTGYRVKINHRVVSGKHLLFLNYRQMTEGRTFQKSKRIAVLGGVNKKEDAEKIKTALDTRAKMEKTIKKADNVFGSKAENTRVIDYIEKYCEKFKNKKTAYNIIVIAMHIKKFSGAETRLSEIDKIYCVQFKEYIEKNIKFATGRYFRSFKQILYRAIDEEIISDMPYLRKLSCKDIRSKRAFLSHEEIKLLANISAYPLQTL